MLRFTFIRAFVSATAATALLAGCSIAANDNANSESEHNDRQLIQIVASTNVWADIALSIGGSRVNVESFISAETDDPHEFSAGATEMAQVNDADIIIVNGDGYDDFLSQLLDGSQTDARVIDVSRLATDETDSDDRSIDNEHHWYNLETVEDVAEEIENELNRLVPSARAEFAANTDAFLTDVEVLAERLDRLDDTALRPTVLMTEALPYYLLADAGYLDVTPPQLASAVEAGSEIPVVALARATEIMQHGAVTLLAVNQQESSAQTDQLIEIARRESIPVLSFSEVLPADTTYIEWMTGYVNELERIG